MADLPTQVRAAASHITAEWSPTRASAVFGQLRQTQKRQKRNRVIGSTLLLLLVIGGALLASRRPLGLTQQLATTTTGVSGGPYVRLGDGSVASVLDPQSRLELLSTQPDKVVIRLRGAASFQVAKNPGRLYRVETERVAVEVLGTRFIVKEQPDHRVHVAVSEGRVRVLWGRDQAELAAGSSGDFPRASTMPAVASLPGRPESSQESPPIATEEVAPPSPRPAPLLPLRTGRSPSAAKAVPPQTGSTVETWQSMAEQGKFELAYQQILSTGAMGDFLRRGALEPSELLLVADVARFSGHPQDAVPPLRQLLHDSPTDPRTPLASFTLGRILLDDLGQPREAAQSFRQVAELEPEGPLSQDALAREVEAWSRAGEQSTAHSRAEEYVRRYPTGRRLRSVRRYGDLD